MPNLDAFSEFSLINRLTRGLPRHPDQVNSCHQSDAEILRQSDGSFFAATVDTLQEEYQMGLLRDPYTLGWSVVAHSLSDLAAVCAVPTGVLLCANFPRKTAPEWGETFFKGVGESLTRHGTYCLGGDTNFSNDPSFTCTAFGRIPSAPPMTRIGAKAGDHLYVTGPLGSGNLLGITSQVDRGTWEAVEKTYRPVARIQEAIALKPFISCAIDTSDALLQALAIIGDLNGVGFRFVHRPQLYDKRLVGVAEKIRFPLWLVNVFGMGEYELVVAVPPEREGGFLDAAASGKIPVMKVGTALARQQTVLSIEGKEHLIDLPYLLNLFGTCDSIKTYLGALVAYHEKVISKP